MKKSIFLIAAILFSFSFSNISAQTQKSGCNKSYSKTSCNKTSCDKSKTSLNSEKGEKETSFKVSGNCGMCEARIEKAALGVNGVKTADWNQDSKLLKITFNGDVKTNSIQESIAAVGHDTGKYKAKDAVYDALPGCCKYER